MMIAPFRRVQVKTNEVQHLQDAVAQVFNQILRRQIIDGTFIEDISLISGVPYSLSHGLDMDPRGWIVVNKDAFADIWQTASDTPTSTMILNSSADVTISLWVF